MRRVSILGIAFLLTLLRPDRLTGQSPDKGRIESEAAGQAAEADRLLKGGEWVAAMAIYRAEQASRAALGDVRYEAYAFRAIGVCQGEMGDDEAAIESWTKARELDLKREDPGYAGYDDFLIAKAQLRLGRIEDGIATLDRAFPRLSQAADRDHETDARLVMTHALIDRNRAGAARIHVSRAMSLAEELGDSSRLADSWAASGQVEVALNNPSVALERFSDAQVLFEELGRADEAAEMETLAGSSLILLGRPDLALPRFEEAAKLHGHLEDGGSLSEDLASIAGLHLESNRLDAALATARMAVEKARDADDRPREVEARVRLAQVQGRRGNWTASAETLDEAVGLVRQVARDDLPEQVRILILAADADRFAGRRDRALTRLESARDLADESGLDPVKEAVEDARRRLEAKPANLKPITPR